MKRLRIARCVSQFLVHDTSRRFSHISAPGVPKLLVPHNHKIQSRLQTTAASAQDDDTGLSPGDSIDLVSSSNSARSRQPLKKPLPLEELPSPHPSSADKSAKLHALRSRLSLDKRFPLQALARTLIHPSADSDPNFNNASLSILGADLLGYYTTEYLLCNYPRLPTSVIFAAQHAYIGPKALAMVAREWGIEAAADPGGEVDPGLLQFKRLQAREALPEVLRRQAPWGKWNITNTHRILATDEFGSDRRPASPESLYNTPVPIEEAAQSFVRALIGSLHLHLGSPLVKRFFRGHFLSRHLDLAKLFDFRTPTRDLSRLCAREGFESPVARLISETGRLSRHPVFIVGVYSGKDKLGEGAGSSLDEARIRAAAAALKAWYLYRPLEVTVPSSTEGEVNLDKWRPNMVDCGEVIV